MVTTVRTRKAAAIPHAHLTDIDGVVLSAGTGAADNAAPAGAASSATCGPCDAMWKSEMPDKAMPATNSTAASAICSRRSCC